MSHVTRKARPPCSIVLGVHPAPPCHRCRGLPISGLKRANVPPSRTPHTTSQITPTAVLTGPTFTFCREQTAPSQPALQTPPGATAADIWTSLFWENYSSFDFVCSLLLYNGTHFDMLFCFLSLHILRVFTHLILNAVAGGGTVFVAQFPGEGPGEVPPAGAAVAGPPPHLCPDACRGCMDIALIHACSSPAGSTLDLLTKSDE